MNLRNLIKLVKMGLFSFLPIVGMNSSVYAAPIPVKVGILLSRTGGMADIGTEGEHGFELAIEELKNNFKNDKFDVTFIFEDSRSAPDLAATAVNKLIKSDHVDVI